MLCLRTRKSFDCLCGAAGASLVLSSAFAQSTFSTPSSSATNSSASTPVIHTIRGQVLNAITGTAIPRALVTINLRAVLTDYQGRFEMANFTETQVFATATKPGFGPDSSGLLGRAQVKVVDLDAPVEIRLYPDGLVTGQVTGSDSFPLSRVQVRLLRLSYDAGSARWITAGFALTDARGEYRMPTPAGRFRLSLGYTPQAIETGQAVLPESFPQDSSSSATSFFTVQSNEERRVDLRPRTGPTFPVTVRVDPAGDTRANARFSFLTSSGESFSSGYSVTPVPGEFRFMLPNGSYTLRAHLDTRDDSLDGSARMTVAAREVSGVVLHLAPDAVLPIELTPELGFSLQSPATTSTSSVQIPDPRQFGLTLHNLAAVGDGVETDVQLRPRQDKTYVFRAPPGRYRLAALSGGGPWHIQSATCGTTDLLSNELILGAGSAGAPIRVVVSNVTGTLHGRLNLPAGLASAWLYLIPRGPSLLPINPIQLSGIGASLTATAVLPAGPYTAIVVDHRLQQDLRAPDFLKSFSKGPKDVDVLADAEISLDLELAVQKEDQR